MFLEVDQRYNFFLILQRISFSLHVFIDRVGCPLVSFKSCNLAKFAIILVLKRINIESRSPFQMLLLRVYINCSSAFLFEYSDLYFSYAARPYFFFSVYFNFCVVLSSSSFCATITRSSTNLVYCRVFHNS